MKVFILDSNIVFSAVLNVESQIGKFLLSASPSKLEFYAPEYLNVEIERYIPKLVELSGLTEFEIKKIIHLIYNKIIFISNDQIPFEHFVAALPYVRDVDMDD